MEVLMLNIFSLQPADALINSFFENFLDLYGLESQSLSFHTMRHLVEQVRRNGPLWLFSAFCFESANHQLVSALSGTIKNPEKIVDRFLRHQNFLDELDIIISVKVSCIESFTKLAGKIKTYCEEKNATKIFARYVNDVGKKFSPLSYTRLNDNVSESVVQLKDKKFVQTRCFAKIEDNIYAALRYYTIFSKPQYSPGKCNIFLRILLRSKKLGTPRVVLCC